MDAILDELGANAFFLLAVPAFLLTMLVEWKLLRGQHAGYTGKDTASSLAMGVGFLVIHAGWSILYLSGWSWAHQFRLFDIPPSWWAFVLLFFAEDLTFYWHHRLSHEVRLFWTAHHTHHSSEKYNLSTALRQSWWEQFYQPFLWVWLTLVGFPVEMIIIQQSISLLYQYWLHTELIGDLGVAGLVLNSPSAHRVHHGRNPRYLDRNYGGILVIWDRLFGTYEPETEPVDYGTVKPLTRFNPLWVAFDEPLAMLRDLWSRRTLRGRLMAVFGPPGWSEDGAHSTAKALRAQAVGAPAVE
ncbi:MAG: sterol desaturase family protein [Alphaproteobacteria bacterium]|nr:sterol desaturase family protein [Alphaproteobacteria bacterium]